MKLSKKEVKEVKKDIKKMSKQEKSQLKKGIKVEAEHTKNKSVRKKIADDHIKEDKKYYDKLKKIEKKKK